MIILSPDPKDAVVQLSEAVNKLSGELAATTAFAIFYAQGKMTDDEMRTVQGIAPNLAPEHIGPGASGVPKLHASKGVENIRFLANKYQSTKP